MASMLGLFAASPAHAQTVWTGALTNEWNTAGNWNPAVVPNAVDAYAVFPAGFPPMLTTITVTGGKTLGRLDLLSTNGSNITGDALTFDTTAGDGIIRFGTNNWSVANNLDLNSNLLVQVDPTVSGTLGGIISDGIGARALTKDGTGILILSGMNGYTGGTTINAGTLQLGAMGALGNGALTVNSPGIFDLNGRMQTVGALAGDGSIQLGTNGALTTNSSVISLFSGTIDGAGSLTKDGTGTLILAGMNGYTGGTTITAGTLQLGATNSLLTTGDLTVGPNGTFNLGGFNQTIRTLSGSGMIQLGAGTLTTSSTVDSTFSGIIAGAGSFVKDGTSVLTLSSPNTYTGGTTIKTGTLKLGAANSLATTGDLTVEMNGTFNLGGFNQTVGKLSGSGAILLGAGQLTSNSGVDSIFSGNISGVGGSFVKQGASTLTLTGMNSYTGGTTVSAGVLQGNTDSLKGTITNNAQVTFDQAANGSYAGQMSGAGSLVKTNTGTLTLDNTNTYSGGTTVNGGTLRLGTNGSLLPIGDLAVAAPGTFDLNGRTQMIRTLSGDGSILLGAGQLTSNSGVNSTFSGNISGVGGRFVKDGNSTLILTGINSYTGGTMVQGGILQGNASSLQGTITNNTQVTFNQTTAGVYSGAMGGSGSLVKTGNGLLILNGANTYSGGTTVNNGTLQLGPTGSLLTTGDLTVTTPGIFDLNDRTQTIRTLSGDGSLLLGAGQLTTNSGVNSVFSGNISGLSGRFVKTGSSTLTLSGINSYTGGTTVSDGILQGKTSSLQGDIMIMNNAQVTFDQAVAGTYAGVLSGSGRLVKLGAGELTLTGENTYSGGTTVTAGTLVGSADNLNSDAALANSLQGDITNNAAVVFDHGGATSGTYAGRISGTGAITKRGTGTLTMTNANNSAGGTGTTVAEGRLNLNGGLTSDVTVANGATLGSGTETATTGTGTITGNLTFSDGSNFDLDVNPATGNLPNGVAGATHDRISVAGGNISIGATNTTVNVTPAAGIYDLGTRYRFLTTDTGMRTGTFATLNGAVFNNGNILGNLVYDATSAQLFLNQTRFAQNIAGAGTRNQLAVARGIDAAAPFAANNALSDGAVLITGLSTLTGAPLRSALDQLSGEAHASVGLIGLQGTNQFVDSLGRRLRANSMGDSGLFGSPGGRPYVAARSVAGDVSLASADDSLLIRAQSPGMMPRGYGGAPMGAYAPSLYAPPSIGRSWATVYGTGGDIDGDGNAHAADYSIGGTSFGIEQNVSPTSAIGLVGGYSRVDADIDTPSSDITIDQYRIGLYGRATGGVFYTTALAAYGFHDISTSRHIVFGGLDRTAKGDYNAHELAAYMENGANLALSGINLQPFVGVQYVHLRQGSFTETGAGAANLSVDSSTLNSLRGSLGARLFSTLPTAFGGVFIPEVRARWIHEFLDTDQVVNSSFAGLQGSSFSVQGVDLGRNYGDVGAGVSMTIAPNTLLTLDYDLLFSDALTSHTGRGGLEFVW